MWAFLVMLIMMLRALFSILSVVLCSAGLALAVTEAQAQPTENPHAQSPTTDESDFRFALLRYSGGQWNPRPSGLPRLAWELRQRTSVAVDLQVAAVDPESSALFQYPLLVWQGDRSFPPLSNTAIQQLRQHVLMGGTLWVDAADGIERGPFHLAVLRALRRIFPDRALKRVRADHVLYKSYFLLDRHGGRRAVRSFIEGIFVENRLAVILMLNDLAGAMARDPFGEWEYDVQGGAAAREMSFRLGVNIALYALCLDYKDDQVHVEYILKRRR